MQSLLKLYIDTSLAAWAFLVGFCTSAYFVVQYGGGVHQWNVPLDKVIEFAKVILRGIGSLGLG